MFYDTFLSLCEKKGVKRTRAAVEMGFSESAPVMWRRRGNMPPASDLVKIADYFGVSVDYLISGGETKEAPAAKGDVGSEDDAEMLALWHSYFPEERKAALSYLRFLANKP